MQDLIKSFIEKNNKTQLYHEQNVIQLWQSETGDFIMQHTKNVEFKQGILYVKLLNASLRFELMGRKSDIIAKLNQKTGIEIVKDILFT
jgi:Protein of unknown function (DUF721).